MGLDFVLNEASKRGIRAVLVLANYWAMYGGIDQYNVWSFEAGSGECMLYVVPDIASHRQGQPVHMWMLCSICCQLPIRPQLTACLTAARRLQ